MTLTTHQRATMAAQLTEMVNAIPTREITTARDWAGFFAALAKFASEILPLLAPLFAE